MENWGGRGRGAIAFACLTPLPLSNNASEAPALTTHLYYYYIIIITIIIAITIIKSFFNWGAASISKKTLTTKKAKPPLSTEVQGWEGGREGGGGMAGRVTRLRPGGARTPVHFQLPNLSH